MANINEMINGIPPIPSQGRKSSGLDAVVVKHIIQSILDWLGKELPRLTLDVKSSDANGLGKDVMNLTRTLDSLQRSIDSSGTGLDKSIPQITSAVNELQSVVGKLQMPEFNFPTSMNVRLSDSDISRIKTTVDAPKFPDNIRINNIKELGVLIEGMCDAIKCMEIPDTVKVSNLKDIKVKPAEFKFPKDVKDALLNLNLLGREAKDAISVRLSDGDEFYVAMAELVGNAVSMAPAPGNRTSVGGASGRKAVTSLTVPVKLEATSKSISRVDITADGGGDQIVVGLDSSIDATSGAMQGIVITPGTAPYTMFIDDISKVYVAGATGSAACYNYFY